jgi:hypothetical protein
MGVLLLRQLMEKFVEWISLYLNAKKKPVAALPDPTDSKPAAASPQDTSQTKD